MDDDLCDSCLMHISLFYEVQLQFRIPLIPMIHLTGSIFRHWLHSIRMIFVISNDRFWFFFQIAAFFHQKSWHRSYIRKHSPLTHKIMEQVDTFGHVIFFFSFIQFVEWIGLQWMPSLKDKNDALKAIQQKYFHILIAYDYVHDKHN